MKPSEYIAKGWCQGVAAKDGDGRVCMPDASYAAKWCLIGACIKAYPERTERRFQVATKLQHKLGNLHYAKWNDDPKRTQAEVIELLQSIGE